MREEGLRFNEGKLRYDLIHAEAEKGLVEILTFGAQKYAERNWEKGMAWSKIISSLKRHIAAIERGEDFDVESGKLHADHVQCNAHFLSAYYRIFPQGDDRPHKYLKRPKIGLDIDGVLCDFFKGYHEKFKGPVFNHWYSDYATGQHLQEVIKDDEFYLSLPALIDGKDIPFEPHCYITTRSIPVEWTEKWLQKNGFPTKKVYSLPFGSSKVEVAKEAGIDIFVDDKYENFVELNNGGICTFLFDAPHNQKYNVGFKRIHSLKELV